MGERSSTPGRQGHRESKKSLTGQYLSGKRKVEVPETRRPGSGKFLEIKGAAQNNLKGST